MKTIPGVEAAGLTDILPMGHDRTWSASAKGVEYSLAHPPPPVFVRIVSDGYVTAMGIPLRRLILTCGMRLVPGGLLAGLALSLCASVVLSRVLFGVHTWDPSVFLASSALLVASALAAMCGPALRAAHADPMHALRHD